MLYFGIVGRKIEKWISAVIRIDRMACKALSEVLVGRWHTSERAVASTPLRGSVTSERQIEIAQYSDMNDQRLDVDVNVWSVARTVIRAISFHLFHRQSKATISF
jgi:hypothetical protein